MRLRIATRLLAMALPTLLMLPLAGCGAPRLFEDGPAEDAPRLEQDLAEARAQRGAVTTEGQAARGDSAATRAAMAAGTPAPGAADPLAAPRSTAVAPSTAVAGQPRATRPASSASPPAAPAATVSPSAAPAAASFIGSAVSGGQIGGSYQLVDLRSGEHAGFTRIVWELEGEAGGIPRFEAVEELAEGGGARIGLSISDLYGYAFVGSLSADTPESPIVRGLRPTQGGDDALMRFDIALARPARFTLVALEAPLRLVLDVHEE